MKTSEGEILEGKDELEIVDRMREREFDPSDDRGAYMTGVENRLRKFMGVEIAPADDESSRAAALVGAMQKAGLLARLE